MTPHVLRHTFMLHHLVQAEGIVHPKTDERSLRSMVVNPVRTLQRLLGHAHIMTTYTYLECVADLGVVEGAASLLHGRFGRTDEA